MPVRDDILAPITGSNPSGVDLIDSGNTILNDIRQARREDAGHRRDEDGEGRVADWARVQKLCSDTLATKSKDLEVAGYLCEALLKREGLAGFRAGIDVITGMLETYWETLHPAFDEPPSDSRVSSRESKLLWLGDRFARLGQRSTRDSRDVGYLHAHFGNIPLCGAGHGLHAYNEARDVGSEREFADNAKQRQLRQEKIDAGKMSLEEFEQAVALTDKEFYKALLRDIDLSDAALDRLRDVTETKFVASAGVKLSPPYVWEFSALRDDLAEIRALTEEFLAERLKADPDPEPVGVESAPDAVEQPETVGAVATPTKADVMVEPLNVDDASKRVGQLAEFLRKLTPTNPGPYLMLRGLRWGELRANGTNIDPRLLVAPPTTTRTSLKTLLIEERWGALLEHGERLMARPEGRGWLELQRYAITACNNLGPEYEAVGAAIRAELALLLRDLPQLVDAALMDETPTVSPVTRRWLVEQGLLSEPGEAHEEARPPVPVVRMSRSLPDRTFEQAQEAVRDGNAKHAIEILMREAVRERSVRGQFLRKTQVAEIMVHAGMRQAAAPILNELEDIITSRSLEGWEEGEVVARPLALLVQCLDSDSDRRDALYQIVCKLDPVRAIGLE